MLRQDQSEYKTAVAPFETKKATHCGAQLGQYVLEGRGKRVKVASCGSITQEREAAGRKPVKQTSVYSAVEPAMS